MAYSSPKHDNVEKPIDFWLRKGKTCGEHKSTEKDSTRNRVVGKSRASKGQLLISMCLILLFSGCSISYKFNGANINYQTTHSISIADFPNNAAMVNPTLSNNLSETIRDLFQRQTRLQVLRKSGDLELEGEITGYDLSQGAISVDNYASESKLTITVMVHFTNNINPEESFDKSYSASQTFDANRLLTEVQDDLCAIIIKEIAENIYNDTVAKW